MKQIIGVLITLCGATAGLYIGGYLMFIGGIIDIIEQIKADEIDAAILAFGIGKFMLSGLVGWAITCSAFFVGIAISNS